MLLLSGGGMDSISALVMFQHKITDVLWIDYGQKAAAGEEASNRKFCREYNKRFHTFEAANLSEKISNPILRDSANNFVLDGQPWRDRLEGNRLEARNLFLLSHAVVLCGALDLRGVMTGFHKEPADAPFPDASQEFYESFATTVSKATKLDFYFSAPFQEMGWDRLDILEHSLPLDPDIWLAFNCYESLTTEWCGRCVHCTKRLEWRQQLGERGVNVSSE